jgi:hypothetical protein
MFISHVFAQTASPNGGYGGVGLFILLIIVLVIVGVIMRTTIIICRFLSIADSVPVIADSF